MMHFIQDLFLLEILFQVVNIISCQWTWRREKREEVVTVFKDIPKSGAFQQNRLLKL